MRDAATLTGAQIVAVPGISDIQPGDDLAALIGDALLGAGLDLQPGDILCLAHKIASKAEGAIIRLVDVTPTAPAVELADKLNKDPRKVQVILDQSKSILRSFRHPNANEGIIIAEHRRGFISANAGVDESNAEEDGTVITLPDDPDASCRALSDRLAARFGITPGIVMTDTFGRPWRLGQVNVAIGLAGVPPTRREQGTDDAFGRPLKVTEPAFADEIAAASGLVTRKDARQPLVLFRGLDWTPEETSAQALLRPEHEDMFR